MNENENKGGVVVVLVAVLQDPTFTLKTFAFLN